MFSPTCTTPMFLTLKCQPSKVSTNLTLQVNFLTHIDAVIFHTIWSRTKMLQLSLASCPHQYLQIPVLCNTSHGLPIRCEGPASSVSDARWPQWTKSNSKVVGKKAKYFNLQLAMLENAKHRDNIRFIYNSSQPLLMICSFIEECFLMEPFCTNVLKQKVGIKSTKHQSIL